MLEEFFQINLSDLTADEQSAKQLALLFRDLFLGTTGDLIMCEEDNFVLLYGVVESACIVNPQAVHK